MNRVVLQVPVDYQTRQAAEKGALAQGFWSLQDAVRLFLNQLAKRAITVTFQPAEFLEFEKRPLKEIEEGFVATGKYNKKFVKGIVDGLKRESLYVD
ncbi:MAG: hypothetical protein AAB506_02115 [Patescibacteria group bacterium]